VSWFGRGARGEFHEVAKVADVGHEDVLPIEVDGVPMQGLLPS